MTVNDAPVVSIDLASQTVQYSDGITPVTIQASDIDSNSLSVSSANLPGDLVIGSEDCTNTDGVQTCTWSLGGQAMVIAGDYDITINVSDGELQSNTDHTIVVEPEDADLSFYDDNPVAVQVAEAGGDSGVFSLMTYIWEYDDPLGFAGDINIAVVDMLLVPVGPGSPISPVTCEQNTTGTGYDAILSATCSFNDVPVNVYTAEVIVNGGFYSSYKEDAVVIYDPSLGFTTGGGWLYWPGTEDSETEYLGDKTNFGYTMKYGKKGNNLKGNLLLIRHLSDGTIYRIKSNALYGLALGESYENSEYYGWASFSGKCTYLDPSWIEPVGNYEFLVHVEDRNEPGTGNDKVWFELRDKDRIPINEMSMPSPATDNTTELQGGNIVAPHR